MPDLIESLQGKDLGHLKIVAELWELELASPDARSGVRRLAELLLDRRRVEEAAGDLPEQARAALEDLQQAGGSLPWPLFTRRYGTVREMGPARRDRERPHQYPVSPAEMLWYRALVGRAFLNSPSGPEEFAYIPDDLRALLPVSRSAHAKPLGRPASPGEREVGMAASDAILDHACSLLAALRLDLPLPDAYPLIYPKQREKKESTGVSENWRRLADSIPAPALKGLLFTAGLVDEAGLPLPEPARAFLEAPRGHALAQLASAWLHSETFNELRLLPGLRPEGEWQNDPLRARQAVLDFLSTLPTVERKKAGRSQEGKPVGVGGGYWSLTAFISAVRQQHPDFQRPAGDYDSWYLLDESSGEFLRGFKNWEAVDGALLRYLICGPLHWLGFLDLAAPNETQSPTAFRFSSWAAALLKGDPPQGLRNEESTLVVRSDALLSVPRTAPRAARYQVARFCEWEGEREGDYLYRLTPGSLERARQQGLRLGQLLALLRRHAPALPPSLIKAIERWEEHGTEARLEEALVLRLRSPDLLQALRASRAARFLGDPLGPTAVIVKEGAWEKVLGILAEMGYLGEMRKD